MSCILTVNCIGSYAQKQRGDLSEELNECCAKMAGMEEDLQSLRAEAASLKEELEKEVQERQSLAEELEAAIVSERAAVAKKDTEIAELSEKVTAMAASNAGEKDDEEAELRGAVSSLEAKLGKALTDIEEERSMAEEAREELSAILDELNFYKKECEKKDGMLKEKDAILKEKEALLVGKEHADALCGNLQKEGVDEDPLVGAGKEDEEVDSWGDDDWGNENESDSQSKLTESQKTISSATEVVLSQNVSSGGSGASSGDDLINSASENDSAGPICVSCQAPVQQAVDYEKQRLTTRIYELEEEAQKAKDSFEVWDSCLLMLAVNDKNLASFERAGYKHPDVKSMPRLIGRPCAAHRREHGSWRMKSKGWQKKMRSIKTN